MTLETLVAQTTREAPPVPMRGPNTQAWALPGASCLRCGGLLVLSYLASLESDFNGRPMRLWRCVNCGGLACPPRCPAVCEARCARGPHAED
jgi:hypothetical protein